MSETRAGYVVSLQGRQYMTYPGVLDKAHADGLTGIAVRLLQVPTPDNEMVAICEATVCMKDGQVFTDIGDASPKNTNTRIATALIRMASTRAKGRALRDAVNIGETLAEELPDAPEAEVHPARQAPEQRREQLAKDAPKVAGSADAQRVAGNVRPEGCTCPPACKTHQPANPKCALNAKMESGQ